MRTASDEIRLCGWYIETMLTMDVGEKLFITLWIENEPIHCAAVVVTKYSQVGNGIDFRDIPPTTN